MARRKPSKKSSPSGSKKNVDPDALADYVRLFDEIRRMDPQTQADIFQRISSSDPFLLDELLPAGYNAARELLQKVDPEHSPKKANQAAQEALVLCPGYMDAYVLLGELEKNSEKVASIYRQGIAACDWMVTAVDSHDLDENPLLFENLILRQRMADHLWMIGQRTESIEIMLSIVPLDESDDMDCRWRLVFCLMEADWIDELDDIMKSMFGDIHESAEHLAIAFMDFQKDGDCESARSALQSANKANGYLMQYLIGEVPFPAGNFDPFPCGSDVEAIWIAGMALPVVRKIPGIGRWMRDTLNLQRSEYVATAADWRDELEALSELMLSDETWILDSRRLPDKSWLTAMVSLDRTELLNIESFDTKPTPAKLWQFASQSMVQPQDGEPRRPGTLLVAKVAIRSAWKNRCQRLDIDCKVDIENAIPDDIFEGYADLLHRATDQLEIDDSVFLQVADLPQSDDAWVAGIFKPPLWITDTATPNRPYMALVLDAENGMVLMQELTTEWNADLLSKVVFKAMLQPLDSSMPPVRPMEVKLHPHTDPGDLPLMLKEVNVACYSSEDTEVIDECMEILVRQFNGFDHAIALLDDKHVSQSDLASLYQSLARFYRASLWRSVPGDSPIEIASPVFERGAWYGIVVGQMGMNLGLVLYRDLESLEQVMRTHSMEHNPDAIFLNYDEMFEIPPMDLWFIEKYDWTIAGEEAYPLIERFLPDQKVRRPNRSELRTLDIAIRSLPAFVSRPNPDDPFSMPITSFGETTEVRLRWLV